MKTLSIWVVEDDHLYRSMLLSYLAMLGYSPVGFDSGEECILRLSEQPDVVLLDHNLGEGMKGLDVLRKIRGESPETKVIYISGEERISLVSDVFQNGSQDFMTKDNASLLRLKLRLENIESVKLMSKQKARKRNIILVSTAALLVLFVAFAARYYF